MLTPLPTIDPPRAGETLHGYGGRVLRFVLEHGCTATLSDRDLELADHVYPIAIGGPGILPAAVDRLSEARHQILAALKYRREADATPASSIPPAPIVPASHDKGRLAPLQPRPFSRPPAGQAVDVRF
jgi:hypothetical protein